MRRRHVLATLVAAGAAVALVIGPQMPSAVADSTQLFVYRVPATSEAAAQRLLDHGFDVLENRSGTDLFVLGDEATAARLRGAGFRPAVSEKLQPTTWKAPSTRLVPDAAAPVVAPVDETYYGGYHTVRAQHAHLDQVAANRPDLATVVDYGDSYLKTRNPATGYDLKAICLTRKLSGDCSLTPSAPKPRFLLMTQIHAREIVTGDIAWRFIDHLVNGYGSNAQVTALLDSTEVWVVPIVNPDGVDLVQQGGNRPYLQRKNLNGAAGCANPPTSSNQVGVDLNRNTANHWGTSGVSSSRCAQTYPGTSADSEPETKAINNLFRRLYADQRGPNDSDAAPATTRGAMISLHSYAGMNLFPWGWSTRDSANDAALRRIAAQMSQYNGYQYGQPGEILYNASGTSDDWSYGELGIASFTTELASCGSFTPAYSCTTTDWNKNLPALMYVAGKAKAPYQP
ncbi:M14 family zinc carboxypeptidase [Planosporangium mesophilum]|uniref:Zinc carboxypeptidase n=1 Tax=Planosporangium mesophilum TaxID=689768 RepID=A0A8J3X2Y2_9ACTN|nr:M14 family zinc carboxypeptidase [Planosporangium mesophilum]NJC85974.1 carboxypeptidase [Planosporangium mesophilum]GII25925.1 peptidase M14 [Planosporangium mesophilum]